MEIEQADHVYRKIRSIQGWFWPQAGRLIAILNACQKRQGVSGNIFEIGVWHGKSAILLASMLANQESLGACDTFDDIAADGGSMKLKRFRQNMNHFFDDASFVRIYSKSSRDLSREEMTVNCRLIHIDGAHDSYNVYEDIVLADSCLHEKGAIVMDDAYQPAWPGVTDGIYRFLHHRPGRLVPLVSGFKKLVLVRPNAVVMYSDSLADSIVLKEPFQ